MPRRTCLPDREKRRCDSVRWSSIPDGPVSHTNPESTGRPCDNACNQCHLVRRQHDTGWRLCGIKAYEAQIHWLTSAVGIRLLQNENRSYGIDWIPAAGDP